MNGTTLPRMSSDGTPGYPAPETFPWAELQEIARELLTGGDGSVLQYGPTRGFRPLLETVAGIMTDRGAATAVERLLVSTGSQQGLDLVARVLVDPGDVVLVELPTYTGAITAFRNVQADMVGVPQEADGISLDALDSVYAALTAQGRWSAWILCGMPFAFGFLAAGLDPNYIPALMEHPFLFFLFFGLWTPGVVWTLKMVRSAGASA